MSDDSIFADRIPAERECAPMILISHRAIYRVKSETITVSNALETINNKMTMTCCN